MRKGKGRERKGSEEKKREEENPCPPSEYNFVRKIKNKKIIKKINKLHRSPSNISKTIENPVSLLLGLQRVKPGVLKE